MSKQKSSYIIALNNSYFGNLLLQKLQKHRGDSHSKGSVFPKQGLLFPPDVKLSVCSQRGRDFLPEGQVCVRTKSYQELQYLFLN